MAVIEKSDLDAFFEKLEELATDSLFASNIFEYTLGTIREGIVRETPFAEGHLEIPVAYVDATHQLYHSLEHGTAGKTIRDIDEIVREVLIPHIRKHVQDNDPVNLTNDIHLSIVNGNRPFALEDEIFERLESDFKALLVRHEATKGQFIDHIIEQFNECASAAFGEMKRSNDGPSAKVASVKGSKEPRTAARILLETGCAIFRGSEDIKRFTTQEQARAFTDLVMNSEAIKEYAGKKHPLSFRQDKADKLASLISDLKDDTDFVEKAKFALGESKQVNDAIMQLSEIVRSQEIGRSGDVGR